MTTPYEIIGGRDAVEKLCNRFYDLIETDPAYAELRAMHAGSLDRIREELTGYMTGWMGGPRDWFAKGVCMVSAHKALDVNQQVADQWSDAMRRAIADQQIENAAFSTEMGNVLAQMASSMING